MSKAFLFAVVLLLCTVAEGVYVFDVYRLVQYEHQGVQLGSHKTLTNLFAATTGVGTEKLAKYILIVPVEELSTQLFQERFLSSNRTTGGLLVLLPESGTPNKVNLESWKAVESELVNHKFDFPIWFAHRTENVEELYQEIKKQEEGEGPTSWFSAVLGADSYRLSAGLQEASKITPFTSVNIQGRLNGKGKTDSASTVALFSHFDSFSVAPGISSEADANGSGVLALLEISRLFSKLYRGTKKTQGETNLLFVLTGAGNSNFEGTKQWLSSSDVKLDALDFALCLDTIGNSEELFLHVSRLASKDPRAKKVYDTFESVAKKMDIQFSVVHKKVNISSDYTPWEHEQFSKKHVLGMTLSGLPTPAPYLLKSSLFDAPVDIKVLKRNTKFVAEVLARIVYGIHMDSEISVFEGNHEISEEYLTSWSKTLSSSPRAVPYISKKPQPPKTIISGLEQEFKIHLNDAGAKEFTVSEPYSVYFDQTKAEMSAYRGKPVLFDVLLSLLIAVYCFALYSGLVGVREATAHVKKLLFGTKKRK